MPSSDPPPFCLPQASEEGDSRRDSSIRGRVPSCLRVGTVCRGRDLMCLREALPPHRVALPHRPLSDADSARAPPASCCLPLLRAGTQGLHAESHPRRPCWWMAEPLCEVPLPAPVPCKRPASRNSFCVCGPLVREGGTGRDREGMLIIFLISIAGITDQLIRKY